MSIKTRQPTGIPSWPLMLIAGGEKTGKSYAAAVASGSEHIGRTFWVGIGEDDPDEYGAIPGARFEIVEHDGTYRGILGAVRDAAAEPADGRPNMIVVDSMTRLWSLMQDDIQAIANRRQAGKAEKSGRAAPSQEALLTMDLWNMAKDHWNTILNALRAHEGPVVMTSRLSIVTVMNDQGQPTKAKAEKIESEKNLPFDVGVVVKMWARDDVHLSGVRSLRIDTEKDKKIPGLDIADLWEKLGVTEQAAPRVHAGQVEDAPVVLPEDWQQAVNDCATVEDARALYSDTKTTGAFESTPGLEAAITAKGTELGARNG